jgi:hypothetical protein
VVGSMSSAQQWMHFQASASLVRQLKLLDQVLGQGAHRQPKAKSA